MSTSYIPSGYCLFGELLVRFGEHFLGGYPQDIGDLDVDLETTRYSTGLTVIEMITQDAIKIAEYSHIDYCESLRDKSHSLINGKRKNVLLGAIYSANFQEIENEGNIIGKYVYSSLNNKTINFKSKKFLKNLLNLIKREVIRKKIRDSLFLGEINSYAINNNHGFEKISPTIWVEDKHWFNLMLDDCVYIDSFNWETLFNEIEIKKIFFKEEEVNQYLKGLSLGSSDQDRAFENEGLNKLRHKGDNHILDKTPWLQAIKDVFENYGEDNIANTSKSALEEHIKDFFKKIEFTDHSKKDIPYMATFVRSPEQKKGSGYHSKRRKKSQVSAG